MALNPVTGDNGNDPAANAGGPPPTNSSGGGDPAWYNQINALYQKYLGRNALPEEAAKWQSGAYGATDLGGIENQIKTSGEAQARIPGGSAPPGGLSPDALNQLYRKYLGRDVKPEEVTNWANGTYGATDMAGIEGQIKGSGEAQAYTAAHPTSGGGTNWFTSNAPPTTNQPPAGGGGGTGSGSGGGGTPNWPQNYRDYGVPDQPYASQPWTGGDYKAPPLPKGLDTPYAPATWQGGNFQAPDRDPALNTPYALRQWTGGNFVAPDLPPALRQGGPNTTPPESLPHFASGVQNYGGGPAVVGEQGPEVVNLPPGSDVYANQGQQGALWEGGYQVPPGQSMRAGYNQQQQDTASKYQQYQAAQGAGEPGRAGFNAQGGVYTPGTGSNAPGAGANGALHEGPYRLTGAEAEQAQQFRAAHPQGSAPVTTSAADANAQYNASEPGRAGLSKQGVAGDPAQAAANAGQQSAQPTAGGAQGGYRDYAAGASPAAGAPPAAGANQQSSFYAPSQADLQNSPGFQSRLALDQQGRERSAAARGSVLSGGTQLELGRAAQDYASNEYNNLFNQSLAARGQNVNEYQNQFGNALASQQQNFGQYLGQAGLDLGARQQNFNEGQGSFNNALAAYNTNYNVFQGGVNNALAARGQNQNEYLQNQLQPSQYGYNNQYMQYLQGNANSLNDYLTNYGINRTGIQDWLTQNNTVANRGLTAALGTRYTG